MSRVPWDRAWQDALYGPDGFYRRPEGPAGHFRTAAHASSSGLLGVALARLAREAGCARVVDVGAGRGELLSAVAAADPGLAVLGVDVVPRPAALPATVGWSTSVPDRLDDALLVGWELLDVVPCPVLEMDDDGALRVVEVAADGSERLAAPPAEVDLAWCARWWATPGARPGDRVEVGRTRDELWAALVGRLGSGLALAVDYGHLARDRPSHGSLTGYRRGRQVPPQPDGGSDLTAHVALDSVAAAAPGGVLVSQAAGLRRLGVRSAHPPAGGAGTDPMGWLAGLALASEAGELLDPAGLGRFGWVLHPRGRAAEQALAGWQDRTEWTPAAPL